MFQFKPTFEKSDHDTVVAITNKGVVTFNQYTNSTTLRPFADLRSITIRRESFFDRIWVSLISLVCGVVLVVMTYFIFFEGSGGFILFPLMTGLALIGYCFYSLSTPLNVFFDAVTKFGNRYRTKIEPDIFEQRLRSDVEAWYFAAGKEHGDDLKFSIEI